MTHDELLDKILAECGCRNTNALLAVLEFRYQNELSLADVNQTGMNYAQGWNQCLEAIQEAIEKELK